MPDEQTPEVLPVSLEDTILLATFAHRGQFDKAGEPYICHPLRLMLNMATNEERIVALLHDTVEDTPVTQEQLEEAGYSESIRSAVALLTHEDGVDYFDYVARIKTNPLATRVKIADLTDNMNLARIAAPSEKDHDRVKKYRLALEMLQS